MPPVVVASGTAGPLTVSSETTIDTETPGSPEFLLLEVDCGALATGEVVFIAIYTKALGGGTERLAYSASFIGGVDADPMQYSVPIPVSVSWRATLTQKNGTGRSFPYVVFST